MLTHFKSLGVVALLGSFLFSSSVFAHPLDLGLLSITLPEKSSVDVDQPVSAAFVLEISSEEAVALSGLDPLALKPEAVGAEKDLLFAASLGASRMILVGERPCIWTEESSVSVNQQRLLLKASALCPSYPLQWSMDFPFLARASTGFEMVVKLAQGSSHREFVARAADPRVEVSDEQNSTWMGFIGMGIKHIGAVPSEWHDESGVHLPEGIDHILFVIALVLGGGGLLNILKTVTGFTLGHSLTLALATLGWIHVPSRLVESGIALSIAIVAGESLFLKSSKGRWKIALCFGLLHGLGFASALSDLHLSGVNLLRALVGFNVGVETGQAVIVAVTLPFILLIQRNHTTKRYLLPTLTSAVLAIGIYWFIRRAFAI